MSQRAATRKAQGGAARRRRFALPWGSPSVLYFAWPEVRHWVVATFARTWANWLACPPSGEGQLPLNSPRVKYKEAEDSRARKELRSRTPSSLSLGLHLLGSRAAATRQHVPWLAAQQELRPPGSQGSTRMPSLDEDWRVSAYGVDSWSSRGGGRSSLGGRSSPSGRSEGGPLSSPGRGGGPSPSPGRGGGPSPN